LQKNVKCSKTVRRIVRNMVSGDLLTISGYRYDYQRRRAVAFRNRFAFIFGPPCPSFVVASRGAEEQVAGKGTINSHEELDAGNGSAAETIGPPPHHRLGRRRRCRRRRGRRRRRRRCEAHVHVAESPDRSFLSRSKNNL